MAAVAPAHLPAARAKERHLAGIFREEREVPQDKNVPAFVPAFGRYHSGQEITVPTMAIRRVAVEAVFVLLMPLFEDLVELLHAHSAFPLLWRLS